MASSLEKQSTSLEQRSAKVASHSSPSNAERGARNVLGIDVSKAQLDYHLLPKKIAGAMTHDPPGLTELVALCVQYEIELVCLENTGGLERDVVRCLQAAGFAVSVVNPRRIRDFAKCLDRLTKTDRLDAEAIALFAVKMEPKIQEKPDENAVKLRAFVARRQQLTRLRVQEINRSKATHDRDVQESLQRALKFLDEELDKINEQIHDLIDKHAEFKAAAERLRDVPGIGVVSSAMLVAELPELGKLGHKQISRLVGVAPINRDSGTLRGKRTTGGGRSHVRRALYMPTLSAIRQPGPLQNFYRRLVAQGKPKMVAVIAAMRKLLTYLNAILKSQQPWNPAPATPVGG